MTIFAKTTKQILDAVAEGSVTKKAAKAEFERRLAKRVAAGKTGTPVRRIEEALKELSRRGKPKATRVFETVYATYTKTPTKKAKGTTKPTGTLSDEDIQRIAAAIVSMQK